MKKFLIGLLVVIGIGAGAFYIFVHESACDRYERLSCQDRESQACKKALKNLETFTDAQCESEAAVAAIKEAEDIFNAGEDEMKDLMNE